MARRADDLRRQSQRMKRKHILMPPELVRHVEAMAAEGRLPFGEIVRRALWRYDFASTKQDDDATLEQLAEALIASNRQAIAYLDKVNKKLDKHHAELTKRRNDLAR
jgi:hypothetical protein